MGEETKIKIGDEELSPEEVSSIILKKLKEDAEDYLGEEVTEAVITVPANFNDIQRKATKEAGEMAGLKVERIINEPTAAALAYGINDMKSDEKVLVYDLGGGTFDVTVLELFEGVIDVKASRGNNKLGGKDFNNIIDRKSTRLNSSHANISYAVFCLKKKKSHNTISFFRSTNTHHINFQYIRKSSNI